MTIRLNGEPHELSGPTTIAVILETLRIDARRVAVEHNWVVIKRDAYDSTMVEEGDEVEIVNFVGGGGWGREPKANSQTPNSKGDTTRALRCWTLAVGSWELAVGSWASAVGSWELAIGSWALEV